MAHLFRDQPARRLGRWLAPSVVAACAGAIAAGVLELTGDGELGGPLGVAAVLGFLVMLVVPLLALGSVVLRALVGAWQPARIAERVIEPGGGAPALAAWVLVIWLGLLGLGGLMFQSIWVLAAQLAFTPMVVSFAMAGIGVAALGVMVAIAPPVARAIAWALRGLDGRWQRRGHRSMLVPWKIGAAVAVVSVVGAVLIWVLLVRTRLGPIDSTLAIGPGLAVLVAIAVHAAWRRLPRRIARIGGGAAGGLAVIAVGCALIATQAAPGVTLAIWGDRPLAGLAIDKLFDLDQLRAGISLAELAPSVALPGAKHPDIILITIDTVRADHTPPYGGRAEMPGLKHLAETGTVFDWAFSPSNVTRRSIPAMVIGLQPNRVRGRVVGWALRVDPRHVLLAERLAAAGYDTAGFMCCTGFWGPEFHTGLQRGLTHLEIDKNGVELAGKARTWLDAREARPGNPPLFLWMHILEPHNWAPGAADAIAHRTEEDKRRMYDRQLALSDSAVVALLGAYARRQPDQMPIVIVTADHGEALGEHGQPFHSTDLYDSQTHVPLVIAGPGVKVGRIAETVSLVDLVPTVMQLAGFQPPSGPTIDGHSLADLITGTRVGDPEGGTAFAAQIKDRSNPGGLTAIVRGKWKLVSNKGNFELYDTRADPNERKNLVLSADKTLLAQLKALLEAREDLGAVSPFP